MVIVFFCESPRRKGKRAVALFDEMKKKKRSRPLAFSRLPIVDGEKKRKAKLRTTLIVCVLGGEGKKRN